jgi:hypothetical protein
MKACAISKEGRLNGGAALATVTARSAVTAAGAATGLSKMHIPPSSVVAQVELYAGAGFMKVKMEPADFLQPTCPAAKRGLVTHFSDASRRRMMDLLAKVEEKQVPLWLDLTYPDRFPMACDIWKRDLESFCKRLARRFPKASAIWKLEFQTRKSGENRGKIAPHFHVLLWGVPWEFEFQPEHGKHYHVAEHCHQPSVWRTELPDGNGGTLLKLAVKDDIKAWARRNWFDVVGSGEIKHYKAGTRVDQLHSRQGAFSYASKKYVCKKAEVEKLNTKPGRFWGVHKRKNLPLGRRQCYRITDKQAVQLRRFIRRHRRATTKPENRRWLRKGSCSNAAKGFTTKHYCHADFWLARLPELVGPPSRG